MIFVALDLPSEGAAADVVARLGPACRAYKVGLELLTSAGPGLARRLADEGCDVFMDLKLFEIPSSVAGAVRAAGRLGASMVTVHAMGGPRIMAAAVEAAAEFPRLRVVALTVVSSVDAADLAAVGVVDSVGEQVARLARLAVASGCDGVVASPGDVAAVRAAAGPAPLVVTPGVTLAGESSRPGSAGSGPGGPAGAGSRGGSEHARADSPAAATRAGATHLVVGRGVTRAADPVSALRLYRLSVSTSSPSK